MKQRLAWISSLFLIGFLSRVIPHAPGFTGLLAVALFSSSVLSLPLALVTTLAAVVCGDLILGLHDLMWVVYFSLCALVILGQLQSGFVRRGTGWAILGLSGNLLFFVTTNLAVWWSEGLYPHTGQGLITCFVLALPFLGTSLLSTALALTILEAVKQWQTKQSSQTQLYGAR